MTPKVREVLELLPDWEAMQGDYNQQNQRTQVYRATCQVCHTDGKTLEVAFGSKYAAARIWCKGCGADKWKLCTAAGINPHALDNGNAPVHYSAAGQRLAADQQMGNRH